VERLHRSRYRGVHREGEGHHGHGQVLLVLLGGHLFRVLFVGSLKQIQMGVREVGDVVDGGGMR
jgi:hypothetical protein